MQNLVKFQSITWKENDTIGRSIVTLAGTERELRVHVLDKGSKISKCASWISHAEDFLGQLNWSEFDLEIKASFDEHWKKILQAKKEAAEKRYDNSWCHKAIKEANIPAGMTLEVGSTKQQIVEDVLNSSIYGMTWEIGVRVRYRGQSEIISVEKKKYCFSASAYCNQNTKRYGKFQTAIEKFKELVDEKIDKQERQKKEKEAKENKYSTMQDVLLNELGLETKKEESWVQSQWMDSRGYTKITLFAKIGGKDVSVSCDTEKEEIKFSIGPWTGLTKEKALLLIGVFA